MNRQKIKLLAVAIDNIEKLEEVIDDLKNKKNYEIPENLIKDEDIRTAIIKALEKKLNTETKELETYMKE